MIIEMKMKRLIFFLLSLITISSTSQAFEFGEFKGCGEYNVAGIFKIDEKESRIEYIVYEGSKSEISIKLKITDDPKAAPYINRASLVRAIFHKTIDKQAGEFEILEVQSRIANPLNGAKDSGFNLIKGVKCD